jgi:hypothetical protein
MSSPTTWISIAVAIKATTIDEEGEFEEYPKEYDEESAMTEYTKQVGETVLG